MTVDATAGSHPALLDKRPANMSIRCSLRDHRSDPGDCPQSEILKDLVVVEKKMDMGRETPGIDHRSSTEISRWQSSSLNIFEMQAAEVHELSSPAGQPFPKTRQHLQLPPFKSLGIDMLHPDYLLTPPDEIDFIRWDLSPENQSNITTSTSHPCAIKRSSEGATPDTPVVREFVSEGDPSTPTPSQTPVQGAMAGTGSGFENVSSGSSVWLEQAVEIASKHWYGIR